MRKEVEESEEEADTRQCKEKAEPWTAASRDAFARRPPGGDDEARDEGPE
jgi:hypothetical protein